MMQLSRTVAYAACVAMAFLGVCGAQTSPDPADQDGSKLRAVLEPVYDNYLRAIEKEDAQLLRSVFTAARLDNIKQVFAQNNMRFPEDYFKFLKEKGPNMPPTGKFRYLATTTSETYANLIYVGNMNGYLRTKTNEDHFLIIQFEKEGNAWKYTAMVDPPVSQVPDFDQKLAKRDLNFLRGRPFAAEKILLQP